METKTCTCCGAAKPATREFFHVYKDDHGRARLRSRCIVCVLQYTKELKLLKSVEKNHSTASMLWCELEITCTTCGLATPHWFREYGRRKCQACKAVFRYPERQRLNLSEFRTHLMLVAESKYLRRYCGQNKCQACGCIHAYDESRHKRWRHLCVPCERLHIRLYRQRQKAKKNDGIGKRMRDALARSGESPRVSQELGYTIAALRQHLERQFSPGMTWEKFNAGDIHIDHITPQAAFDLSDPAQWRACWSLGNLRPMWAAENIAKAARLVFLL